MINSEIGRNIRENTDRLSISHGSSVKHGLSVGQAQTIRPKNLETSKTSCTQEPHRPSIKESRIVRVQNRDEQNQTHGSTPNFHSMDLHPRDLSQILGGLQVPLGEAMPKISCPQTHSTSRNRKSRPRTPWTRVHLENHQICDYRHLRVQNHQEKGQYSCVIPSNKYGRKRRINHWTKTPQKDIRKCNKKNSRI
jgi:hypothetical protein